MAITSSTLLVVDTDVLVELGRGNQQIKDQLLELERTHSLAASAVTQMELVVGCRNEEELNALARFLARFAILHIDQQISREAVRLMLNYRLSHTLLMADALIAATALVYSAPPLTRNQRHFRFVAGLILL
ncbi:MAG: type II toxin-antitoxin system VapC family toxin [Anaerolineae bacterium]|nr:type II toxin-antitoxin system VapC family toxin [Anaerolineae bacterium]